MRGLVLIAMLFISMAAMAAEGPHFCMTTHMKEAMKLNRQRDPWYSGLSQGQSKEITRRLLFMERRLVSGSPIVDLWARPYQKAGVPIMCEDVIDMAETPAFRAHNPEGRVPKESYRAVQIQVAKDHLNEKLKQEDFVGMGQLADQYVIQLEKQPRFNCLVRHMFESIRRTALLAPRHEAAALQKGLRSPRALSKLVLKSHLSLLNESAKIDLLAVPLQADGIMILCQDVPFIPKP